MSGQHLIPYDPGDPEPERPRGLFRIGISQVQSWCEERRSDAEVRRLQSQTRLIQARHALMEAQFEAMRSLHLAAAAAEEAASERGFRRTLREVSPRDAHRILRIALEEEVALVQREQLRRYRLAEGVIALPEGLIGAGATGGLEVDLNTQEIERLALRAVTQIQALPPAEREAAFTRWKQEIGGQYPAFAVAEVTRRAEELRALL
jgi:hypothetical protein